MNSGDIRVARFRKHAASPAHRTAESMAGGKAPALEEIGGFSPTMSEWKSVISHSKPGHCQADVDDAVSCCLCLPSAGQQVELKKIATKASPYYFQEAVRPPCVARVPPCTAWQANTRLAAVFVHGLPCANMAASFLYQGGCAMLAHGLPGGSTAGKYAFGRRVLTRLTYVLTWQSWSLNSPEDPNLVRVMSMAAKYALTLAAGPEI